MKKAKKVRYLHFTRIQNLQFRLMSSIIDVTKLVSLFIEIDDFALSYTDWNNKKCLITPELGYSQKSLSDSEIMTILVLYQESGYKNFQYFYERFAMNELRTYFPKLVSYSRFVEYIPMVFWEMYFFTQYRCALAARTGLYITDSKKIEVCKLRKSKHHKVFKELASKSKSSTGWFFGLKIHLVINDLGEIVKFEFTTGKVADNNHELLKRQFQGLEGKCAGDRGYLSTLFDFFLPTRITNSNKNKS